ncbi:putative TGF-beta-activated kinase 1 and MAP3K7-binding protein 1 [Apostichopus japonicus]|uniref:Putative TGF-beta-activated kinase 1 and MAP3K7-binding protein 1 n=1 Tax=Stichopus japonicus TaxID=307972 RepID=A0A2G8L194_STIJA|nr:putative TGF-beta-activated kinase 1 and MAP3K7-binding protein 1 [Apostichopus japonicus]
MMHFPSDDSPADDEESWTDALPICQHSGIGSHQNQSYRGDGSRTHYKESEDFFFHFRTDNAQTYLYAIFDGYDGKKVASFAHQRLPAELLLGQLEGHTEDIKVKAILRQAILTVERSYFETIDSVLAERAMLTLNLPEGYDHIGHTPALTHQEEIAQLRALDERLRGGTALMVALLHHQKLYIANVGDSRALLCTRGKDRTLDVVQVSVDHSLRNDDEVLRLEQLGLPTTPFRGNPSLAIVMLLGPSETSALKEATEKNLN